MASSGQPERSGDAGFDGDELGRAIDTFLEAESGSTGFEELSEET